MLLINQQDVHLTPDQWFLIRAKGTPVGTYTEVRGGFMEKFVQLIKIKNPQTNKLEQKQLQ